MRRPLWNAAVLALVLFAGGLAASFPARAHPYHLQFSNELAGNTDPLDSVNWLAQSIVPTSRFYFARVSLLMTDLGPSENVTVSIRPDAGGFPSGTVLSQGTSDGPSSFTWLDFDLSPYVELAELATYWIVAQSGATVGQGYEWASSPNNLAYVPGIGVRSSDGISWSPRGRDFTFRVYGFVQPSLSFSVAASTQSLRPGQTAVFRVNFTNSGAGSSEALWVNVSLPMALGYVSDDAAAIGGTRSGSYSFAFSNVDQGSYTFNITVAAVGGTPDGTDATTTFAFEAKDHVGAPLVTSLLDVPATIHNARLAIFLEQSATAADPTDLIWLNATITNVGQADALDILIEGTIDRNATYRSSVSPATYDVSTRTVLLGVSQLPSGSFVFLNWTVAVNAGVPDLAWIQSDVVTTYSDPTGALLPRQRAGRVAYAQVPIFAPVLLLERETVERGEELVATLYFNNTGSTAAQQAEALWDLRGHYELVALIPPATYAPTVDGFKVLMEDIAPGSHALLARLQVVRGLDDGLAMPVQVTWNATDGNGNPLLSAVAISAAATLLAPRLFVTVTGPEQVEVGDIFVLTVTLRNDGRATGAAWLNFTVPNTVELVGDNATRPPERRGRAVSWNFPAILAGGAVVLELRLRAPSPLEVESFRLFLDYTDLSGSPSATLASNAWPVKFLVTTTPPTQSVIGYLAWIIAATLAIAGAVAAVEWRRRGPAAIVDEVFVADQSGVLLAHRRAGAVARQDEDVLIAMFKVVQDFVRDAFSEGADEEMRGIEFGKRRIKIERGKHHFIAVIYRGDDRSGELAARLKHVSQQIDAEFGPILASWSGELETVRGISLLLPKIWRRRWSLRRSMTAG